MKKHVNLLLAALLGLSIMGIPACGGSSDTAATDDKATEAAEQQEEVVDPAEKFYGTWKLAGLESEGMLMVGDFTAMLETDDVMTLTLEKGGKAIVSSDGEDGIGEWELSGDDAITIKDVASDADDTDDAADDATDDTDDATDEAADGVEGLVDSLSGDGEVLTANYMNGILVIDVSDEDFAGKIYFSSDGVLPDHPVMSTDNLAPVASLDELVGEWEMSCIYMQGLSVYGDAESLTAMAGGTTDTSLTIAEDGSATMMGGAGTIEVGDDGAAFVLEGIRIPAGYAGDDLVFDFSDALGMDMAMGYVKK